MDCTLGYVDFRMMSTYDFIDSQVSIALKKSSKSRLKYNPDGNLSDLLANLNTARFSEKKVSPKKTLIDYSNEVIAKQLKGNVPVPFMSERISRPASEMHSSNTSLSDKFINLKATSEVRQSRDACSVELLYEVNMHF